MTLGTEGRRPQPLVRDSLIDPRVGDPGRVGGRGARCSALGSTALQVGVTLGVFATLAVRALARRRRDAGAGNPPRWAAPAAGFASGALTTSTNTAGPPVVLYALARGATPVQTRDTLTVTFIGFALLGAAALALGGAEAPARGRARRARPGRGDRPPARPARCSRASPTTRYEPVLTAVLIATALAGLATALLPSLEVMDVEIWSDIACPWCYVGKRRFEAALAGFEHRDDVNVRWRSFELDPARPPRASAPRRAPRGEVRHERRGGARASRRTCATWPPATGSTCAST